ncbi:MAG: hypothetical protein K2X47_13210, partial [Bdellovibrionales bacterium]|nr:hypothetical protein [Bdellovibrionales bacterium]
MLRIFRGFLFFNIFFLSWGMLAFGSSFCDGDQQRILSGDPFFEPAFFSAGPNKGKCAKLTPEVRVPRVLSEREAAGILPYRRPSELVVANVLFQKQLHVARLSSGRDVRVYLSKKYSVGPAAHASLVFEFIDSGSVDVVSQVTAGNMRVKTPRVLVYDMTGIQAEDDPISVERAGLLYQKRVITPRVIQAFENLQSFVESIPVRRRLELFPLNVTPDQAHQVLLTGIRRSVHRGYRDFFSLLNSNCIFDVFRVLDQALGFSSPEDNSWRGIVAGGVSAFRLRLPMEIERMLIQRGLWVWGKSRS